MERIATTPGLFPLPDWAKETLGDLKGHQKDDLVDGDESEAVTDAYDRARAEVIEAQREAGLGRIVEGQLRWDDMLAHPLAVHDAVETRGIVRYYDNNNFYREPVVTGPLTPDGDVADDLAAAADLAGGDPLQAVLPGPYSLADLATDDHYGDDREFLAAIAEFLRTEARALPESATLFLLDPSLATNPPADGATGAVTEALETVAGNVEAEVVVHIYWGAPPAATYAAVLDAGIDAVGYDLVTAREASLANVREHGTARAAALGVADGQNTRVESQGEIDRRVAAFADAADVERAYLTTNTELFYLPVNKFEAKLGALAEAAVREVEA